MASAELTLAARTDTPFPDDTPRFSPLYPRRDYYDCD